MANKKMLTIDFDTSDMEKELKKFFNKIDPKAREKGLMALGLKLLNYTVNGSPRESSLPPIRDGRLRGSGSVFVGNKKIGDTLFAGKGKGTPVTSLRENNPNVVTIGFNTPYAAKMHENLIPYGEQYVPGGKVRAKRTKENVAGVRGKFLENHLKNDKKELYGLYVKIYRKAAGT